MAALSAQKKQTEDTSLDDFPLDDSWKDVEITNVNGETKAKFGKNSIGVAEGLDTGDAISLAVNNQLNHLVN